MLADSMESQCHMFCACPKLSEFWPQFFKTIENILDINLNDKPHIFLLLFLANFQTTSLSQLFKITFLTLASCTTH